MQKRLPHRWFHALVVTGASITACGGQTDDSAADAADDGAPAIDGATLDVAPRDADAGGLIIVIDTGDPSLQDVRNDPRCCTITR